MCIGLIFISILRANSVVTFDFLCNAIELTGPKVRARDGDQPDGEAGGRRVGRPTQEAPFDHQGLKFIIDDKAEINNVEVNCRTTNLLVIISSCPYLNIWVLYHALFYSLNLFAIVAT